MCTLCQALDPFETTYDYHDTGTDGALAAGTGTVSGDAAALPMYTVDQIADYLTDGYWEDTGRGSRSFDVQAGGSLTVDLSALSNGAQATAWQALDAWTAVSGITFVDASTIANSTPSFTTVSEQGDAGGGRAGAQSMTVNQVFTGEIAQSGDKDWIAIDLQAGETYSISMQGDGADGSLPDTYLRFYDDRGNLLEQNDDRAPGDLSSAIEFTASRSGTYYVEAAAYGANTGSYAVTAQSGRLADVDISFREDDSGAYSNSFVRSGEILSSSVNVSSSWTQYGAYYLQTYIHEIGHALGLGHSGNYNGSSDYATDAHYANDSWQMSAMSYFNQRENPLDDGSYLRLVSPQLADILAIHNLYGTPTNTRTENTTYGDGHTTGSYGFGMNGSRAMTIVDGGGIDTIDLGSRSEAQFVDLRQEEFSSVGGSWGNLAIARGTVIENATTGSGNDRITGNDSDNLLRGGGGDDQLFGRNGDDSLEGGWGSDKIDGGAGTDTAIFAGSVDAWAAVWDGWTSSEGGLKIKNVSGGAIDELTGIEILVFDDAEIDVASLRADLAARFGSIPAGSGTQHTAELSGGDMVAEVRSDTVDGPISEIASGPTAAAALLEIGNAVVDQELGQWHRVDFSQAIADAAVVMGPATSNGYQELSIRVRNVSENGFEFQIDEWDHLDGRHITEQVSWVAGSRGTHELADGTRITLGQADANDVEGGRVSFSDFQDVPMVFAQLTGEAEDRALTHRIDNVSSSGFDFDVQVEEAARAQVTDIADEDLYWLAIDPSEGSSPLRTGVAGVDHNMTGLGASLDGNDAFFADMQTMRGSDTAGLRYETDGAGRARIRVEEEHSRDDETNHYVEQVAWFSMDEGVFALS